MLLKYSYKICKLKTAGNRHIRKPLDRKYGLVKGFGNVNIRQELIDLIKLLIKAKDVTHTEVAPIVHDAVIEYLTKRGYYPGPPRLEHLNISAERVLLKDRDIASVVGVSPRNGYLRCEHDHSDDCIHVKFAYELEEVKKAVKEGKLKKPKK